MIRVLFSTEETIHSSTLKSSDNIGFVSADGTTGYIIHDNNSFRAIASIKSMGNCNWSYDVGGKNPQEVLSKLCIYKDDPRKRITEVFIFEKRTELYNWLANETTI